jgi:hypothetical protein
MKYIPQVEKGRSIKPPIGIYNHPVGKSHRGRNNITQGGREYNIIIYHPGNYITPGVRRYN